MVEKQKRTDVIFRNLHSSPVRWRPCCWGHLGHLLGYSGAAPAGWSWSYYSRSGSRSSRWNPPSWTEYQRSRRGSKDCCNISCQRWILWSHISSKIKAKVCIQYSMTHPAWIKICLNTGRDSPWGQQITDRVPGTDEHFRLVASEYCSFTGWYLHIYIHLHGLTVVIWGEWYGAHTDGDTHKHTHIYICIRTRMQTHICPHLSAS